MPRHSKVKTDKLIETYGKIAEKGSEKLLEMLEDPAVEWNPMSINIVTGTAADKIAKYEGWERAGHGEAGEWARQLVAGLKQLEGSKISLIVEPSQTGPRGQPIEIEATAEPRGVEIADYAPPKPKKLREKAAELARLRDY